MKAGDRVQVSNQLTLGADNKFHPRPCTLVRWHPNPRATGGPGEWEYVRDDTGLRACAPPQDIFPWDQ